MCLSLEEGLEERMKVRGKEGTSHSVGVILGGYFKFCPSMSAGECILQLSSLLTAR